MTAPGNELGDFTVAMDVPSAIRHHSTDRYDDHGLGADVPVEFVDSWAQAGIEAHDHETVSHATGMLTDYSISFRRRDCAAAAEAYDGKAELQDQLPNGCR